VYRVALAVLVSCLASGVARAEPFQTNVPNVILIDAATRTVLFERGADDRVTPASTAKLMTAAVVFDLLKTGKLTPDTMFKVSQTAWRQGGALSRGSTMFAALNSEISVDNLLHGLIVDSGNDAAITLAEGVAGSEGAFATLMTTRARDLGLRDLTFTNAWGRADPDQKVTAREMAFLADDIIETYPELYKIFGEREFAWNKIKQPNRNPLLFMDIGADGLKTGNIDDSGYALVGSAVQNGQRLIVALYGARTGSERAEEGRKLLQWGFRSFESKALFKDGETVGQARVYGGESREVPLVADRDIRVLIPRDSADKLTAHIAYMGPLSAPVTVGQSVGALKIMRGGTEVLSVPLKAGRAVAVGSLPSRALDAGLEYMTDLFRKYVLKSSWAVKVVASPRNARRSCRGCAAPASTRSRPANPAVRRRRRRSARPCSPAPSRRWAPRPRPCSSRPRGSTISIA
jgi:D-alanyl-D-alanine carboxypeptidase (penicillin-binding protein 5/6)